LSKNIWYIKLLVYSLQYVKFNTIDYFITDKYNEWNYENPSLSFNAIIVRASSPVRSPVRSRSSKSHSYVMSIRKILSPLLIISYVCGSRVIEFPTGVPRQWFGLLYILLVWSLYNFVFINVVILHMTHYSTLYNIWYGINMFIALLSISLGIYHDKVGDLKNINILLFYWFYLIIDFKIEHKTFWFSYNVYVTTKHGHINIKDLACCDKSQVNFNFFTWHNMFDSNNYSLKDDKWKE